MTLKWSKSCLKTCAKEKLLSFLPEQWNKEKCKSHRFGFLKYLLGCQDASNLWNVLLRITLLCGLRTDFFHFSWQLQYYYGPFLEGDTHGGLQLSLTVCGSPCTRLFSFACAEELLQDTLGEWKIRGFSSEHRADKCEGTASLPAQQDMQWGVGKDLGKVWFSAACLKSWVCFISVSEFNVNWSWGWSFYQMEKSDLFSKCHPFLVSSDAGNQARICFQALNIQHFGLHNCSWSCMGALLCSLLFSHLDVWRRACIGSMQLSCISCSPVPWKNRSYGWMALENRPTMLLQACPDVTYLLQWAFFHLWWSNWSQKCIYL